MADVAFKLRTPPISSALLAALTVGLVGFSAQPVRADFSGLYAVRQASYLSGNLPAVTQFETWTLDQAGDATSTFGGGFLVTDSTELIFNTGITITHSVSPFLDWQFTHTIPADGLLSFDYSLTLKATGAASDWNYGGYILDGVLVKLAAGTGSVVVPVKAGDVFGFEAYASVNCILCEPPFNTAGSTYLTIENFDAPVPEPSLIALLVCAAGFAVIWHKSSRGARRSGTAVNNRLRQGDDA
jgi:hypothetical protein